MPSQSVFNWRDGRGWLIFAGGWDDDIRALALARDAADGGVACVALSGDSDELLDDISDLGAPSGFIVDLFGDLNAHKDDAQTPLGRAMACPRCRRTLAEPRTISSGEPRPARGVTVICRACW